MVKPEANYLPTGPCKVRALYSWSGEQQNDLGFVEGDIIEVVNTGDGDWWTGKLQRNKVVGTFPRNFVEYVNPNQKTVYVEDQSADMLRLSLGSSNNSGRSTKSTAEILEDITSELNSLPANLSLLSSRNNLGVQVETTKASRKSDQISPLINTPVAESRVNRPLSTNSVGSEKSAPPVPPPHQIVPSFHTQNQPGLRTLNSEQESNMLRVGDDMLQNLMEPISSSPEATDIPLDPRAFLPQSPLRRKGTNFSDLGVKEVVPVSPKESFSEGKFSRLFRHERRQSASLHRVKSNASGMSAASHKLYKSFVSPIKSFAISFNSFNPSNHLDHHAANLYLEDSVASCETKSEPELSSKLPQYKYAHENQLDPQWMSRQRDLYRARTLTKREVDKRVETLALEGVSTIDPIKLVLRNASEYHDYRLEDFSHVDKKLSSISSWPKLMTPAIFASSRIGRVWKDEAERLRAVYILCALNFEVVLGSEEPGNSSRAKPMQKKCTPHGMALCVQEMCQALGIECRIVGGRLRRACANVRSTSAGVPHYWNAVQIENEWRFMDVSLSSLDSDDSDMEEISERINTDFFLVPPHEMIFTHIPSDNAEQHLIPPIPTATLVTLPVAAPASFVHHVEFCEYNLALTQTRGLEILEFNLRVPNPSIDLNAQIECYNGLLLSEGTTLAQAYWQDHERRFRVKAFLPEGISSGVLRLYLTKRSNAVHSKLTRDLLWAVPISHQGENAPFEFVHRIPTPLAQRQDLYIREPQCKSLRGGESYTFSVDQRPSCGPDTSKGIFLLKIAIQSPSGRLKNLVTDASGSSNTWKATVRTLEVGTWRAVVSRDNSDSSVSFAEWSCT